MKFFFLLMAICISGFSVAGSPEGVFWCSLSESKHNVDLYRKNVNEPRNGYIARFKKFSGLLVHANFDKEQDLNFVFEKDNAARDHVASFRFNVNKMYDFSNHWGGEYFNFTNPITGQVLTVSCATLWR